MKDWKQCIINKSVNLYTAIEKIDKSSLQIALIVDEKGRLLGTLTDGDVRRALLKGKDIKETKVTEVMNSSPKTAKLGQSKENILQYMKYYDLKQIPIVQEDNFLVGLETLDIMVNEITRKDNPVVIMAGGLGTRLRPLTEACPKPMLKIGSKPILETIINSFIEQGFYNFYLAVNYKSEMIKNYFKDGSKLGVNIFYLEEQRRSGTAGALSLLKKPIEKPIIVMNGDILTKVNFGHLLNFHKDNNSFATMGVREYTYQVPYGVIELNNNEILKITEKPSLSYFVSGGIYVINPEILGLIPQDEFYDMPNLFQRVIDRGNKVIAFPIREYWIDIGQKIDFERAQEEYQEFFD